MGIYRSKISKFKRVKAGFLENWVDYCERTISSSYKIEEPTFLSVRMMEARSSFTGFS